MKGCDVLVVVLVLLRERGIVLHGLFRCLLALVGGLQGKPRLQGKTRNSATQEVAQKAARSRAERCPPAVEASVLLRKARGSAHLQQLGALLPQLLVQLLGPVPLAVYALHRAAEGLVVVKVDSPCGLLEEEVEHSCHDRQHNQGVPSPAQGPLVACVLTSQQGTAPKLSRTASECRRCASYGPYLPSSKQVCHAKTKPEHPAGRPRV